MTGRFGALLLCPALLGLVPPAGTGEEEPPGRLSGRLRIALVGDSTVTDDKGWGWGFAARLEPHVVCRNFSLGGRSSRSYRAEGRWEPVLAWRPDYVLVQFGHNDMPGKGPERETDPATTFRENLARYVLEARAAGAAPVLVTSLTRRRFSLDGRIHSDLEPYAAATRAVAEDIGVPLVDLHARSVERLDALGPEGAARLDLRNADGSLDRTHLDADGSRLFGGIVADELRRVVPALARDVTPRPNAGASGLTWKRCLDQPSEWYGGPEASRVADNVLLFQRATGGWPKNVDLARPLSDDERAAAAGDRAQTDSTIDNGATWTEMRFLARVFSAGGDWRLRAAFDRGLHYLFAAQYSNGGWPQFFPLRDDYSRHVTFNDGAMVGVLGLLRDVAAAEAPFAFVPSASRQRAKEAFTRGVRLILAAQVRVGGRRTVWCAQHDETTLEPRGARTYEHPSLSGSESVGIVDLLMSIEPPTPEIVAAVQGAVAWFREAQIRGWRVERRTGAGVPGGYDVAVVDDPAAPPLWARFYEIGTNRPIFSGRDGVVRYSLGEIERERRVGYSWVGPYATDFLEIRYPAWAVHVAPWVADRGDGTYRNPVLFFDFSDPDVVRVGDTFTLVASTFSHVPGLTLLESKDLVNWRYLTAVLPRLEPAEAFAAPSCGNGVWAPSIRFHDGRFRIYFPDPDRGIFLVTATRPEGPWSEPVAVKTGRGLIDPCPLWDDDGSVWLVHAWARSRAGFNNVLTLNRLSADGTRAVDTGTTVVDGNALPGYRTLEGPKLYKRDGYYYIFAPAGGVKEGWQSVFRSRSITGPWEDRIVLEQGRTAVNGPHQGAWVETPSGEGFFLHFQDREAFGRVVHLQPLRWKDGWPVIGADDDGDGRGEPVLSHRKPAVASPPPRSVLPMSDEFEGRSLGPQWQWEANPEPGWSSLAGGSLFLPSQRADETDGLWSMASVLGQRLPGPAVEATLALRLAPRAPGERAGLVVLGSDYSWIGLRRAKDGVVIARVVCRDAPGGGREEVVASAPAPLGTVYLRVEVDEAARCRFAYSTDDVGFTPLGPDFQAVQGRWVGARLGLFAAAPPAAPSTGRAEFLWFRVTAPQRGGSD